MSKVIGLSFLSLLVMGWLDNLRSPFYPDVLAELHLNGTTGALFFAIVSLAAFLSSWSGTYWLKTFSSVRLLQSSLTALGLTFFILSQARSLLVLIVVCLCFGLAYGLLSCMQNVVIQEYAPIAYKRSLFVGLHSMYGLAALLAPLSASLFVVWGWTWRGAFAALSLLPVAMALLTWKMFQHPTQHHAKSASDVARPFPSRLMLTVVGLLPGFYIFGELGVSTRLVLYLRTGLGFSPEDANLYLAGFFVALLLGRLVFTFLRPAISNERILFGSAFLSAGFVAAGIGVHPLWMCVSGLTMAPFYPISMAHLAEVFGAQFASRALAFGIALAMLMTVVLHFLLGVLTDAYGIGRALWLAPFGLVVVVFLLATAHQLASRN